jgi:hypothetical protein
MTEWAGSIHIELAVSRGQVQGVEIRSSRPTDLSQRLFAGCTAQQVMTRLPRLFSICVTAQSVAAVEALERAAGMVVDPAQGQARQLLLMAETAREHLFRLLVGWRGWLGEAPEPQALALLGRQRSAWPEALYPEADAFIPGGGSLQPHHPKLRGLMDDLQQLGAQVLGATAGDWLKLHSEAALWERLASSDALAPRLLAQVRQQGLADLGASPVAPLPPLASADLDALLGGASAAAFVRTPLWQGQPRETGAWQRQRHHPLLKEVQQRHGNGLLGRQLARLNELAAVLEQMSGLIQALDSAEPGDYPEGADGIALAQVEAARGRLVHRLRLDGGQVVEYRILAPTEWNFHPEGVLAQGLGSLPADQRLPRLASLLVDAIDPCVEATLTITDH